MRFGTASFFENIYHNLFLKEKELSFFITLNKVIFTPSYKQNGTFNG